MAKRVRSVAEYKELMKDPRVRALMDLVAELETDASHRSDNGYRVQFGDMGNGTLADLSRHPNNRKYTASGTPTTAAGRYQFIYDTWQEQAKKLGLKDFSPESQDLAFLALADQTGALDRILANDFPGALSALGTQWASVPGTALKGARGRWNFGRTAATYNAFLGKYDPDGNMMRVSTDVTLGQDTMPNLSADAGNWSPDNAGKPTSDGVSTGTADPLLGTMAAGLGVSLPSGDMGDIMASLSGGKKLPGNKIDLGNGITLTVPLPRPNERVDTDEYMRRRSGDGDRTLMSVSRGELTPFHALDLANAALVDHMGGDRTPYAESNAPIPVSGRDITLVGQINRSPMAGPIRDIDLPLDTVLIETEPGQAPVGLDGRQIIPGRDVALSRPGERRENDEGLMPADLYVKAALDARPGTGLLHLPAGAALFEDFNLSDTDRDILTLLDESKVSGRDIL